MYRKWLRIVAAQHNLVLSCCKMKKTFSSFFPSPIWNTNGSKTWGLATQIILAAWHFLGIHLQLHYLVHLLVVAANLDHHLVLLEGVVVIQLG